MDVEAVTKVLRDGSAEERRRFVETLPENSAKPLALALISSDSLGMVIVSLGPMILKYCAGEAPEAGSTLALAVHTLAIELFEAGGDHGLIPTTLSGLACQYMNALNLLGRSEETIEFADRWIPYYSKMGESQNLPTLKTGKIIALVNLRRIDEADEMLKDPELRGNWANDIEVARLEKKIEDIKRSITTVQSGKGGNALPAGNKMVASAASRAVTELEKDPEVRAKFGELLGKLVESDQLNASTPEGFRKTLEALRIGERMLAGSGGVKNERTLNAKIREASAIFAVEQKPALEKIRASLRILETALSEARGLNLTDAQNDALWGIYLCRSRLGELSPAADALIELRNNLEGMRARIKNPRERGGVFAAYPYLSDALCEKLQGSGRIEDLLTAIEASKGRGIADILTGKSDNVVPDRSIYDAVSKLPELMRRHKCHYLTFYVDQERVYVVLVDKAGERRALGPMPVTQQRIRELSEHVDPRTWGQPLDYDASVTIPNVSTELAPLVAVLGPLFDAGTIAKGDHICCSADDSFNNIPIHYLAFRDKFLIDFVSVSRIHNAFHLMQVLKRGKPHRPKGFASFIAPTRQDIASDSWKTRSTSLRRPTAWLAKHLRGQAFENEDASMRQLGATDLRDKVVQLSTHGIFPRFDKTETPFTQSGLLMAENADLPDLDAVARGDRGCVLTPSKVFDMKLDLSGSHVSVMACVSGLSREGVGGDALGLDWAFIQTRAASLLSSHWDVSAALAGDFLGRFYQGWIGEGKSRAQAHVDAMRKLRLEHDARSTPYGWAAFSLTGDWR